MKQIVIQFLALMMLLIFVPQGRAQIKISPLTTRTIHYRDAGLEKLIPRSSKIEIIGSGFQHIEGTVWVKDSSLLLFSDTKGQIIYCRKEGSNATKFLMQKVYWLLFTYA